MQGYGKRSLGPSITVHYNGLVEVYMQGYIKGSEGPSLTVHYNG
jgi:hypothetical protein